MLLFEWIVAILVGAVILSGLARRCAAPAPAFLALGGVGLAFVPGVPILHLDPELALALFLAPVLVEAGYQISLRDLRANWRPVAGLALGAVTMTTAAVAVIAKMLVPDMPIAAAIVLGAIVAPPDAVAAISVLRHVKLPHRLATILRGESLLNDASALLIYRLGIAAVATGDFSLLDIAPTFLTGVVASVVAGPILAVVYLRIMRLIDDVAGKIVLQFAAAFGIWLLAEHLGLSGVLTIVTFAITVARSAPAQTGPRARVISYAVWDTTLFVLNVLGFVLIGDQIGPILERLSFDEKWSYGLVAAAVAATVIVVRIAWVLPASGIRRIGFGGRSGKAEPQSVLDVASGFQRGLAHKRLGSPDLGPSAGFAVSWAGMRGLVTIAAALALPEAFPYRDLIILTAFTVVIGTLVVQGLTLGPLLAWLRLEDDDPVGHEVGWGRAEAYAAAMDSLQDDASETAEALKQEFRIALKDVEDNDKGLASEGLPADDARRRAVLAARERVLAMRKQSLIGDDAYYVLEQEFDWAELSATPRDSS